MEDERTQQHTESITMNSLEIDTIGEILNISMGSAATAISTMLDPPQLWSCVSSTHWTMPHWNLLCW